MKKTVIIVVLAICITAFITYRITTRMCNRPTNVTEHIVTLPKLTPNTTTLDTFSVESATRCIHIFDSTWRSYNPGHPKSPISAFTIKAEDLLASMGIVPPPSMSYAHVRVYLGLTMDDTFKLFVVPVDNDGGEGPLATGKDHFFNVVDGNVQVDPTPHQGQYVMDLNAPCPFTCDEGSPLYFQDNK